MKNEKEIEIEILKDWIKDSENIVFFGGAGVSTESNIPDFRSVDGLYHQKYDYPPEKILSHSFFISHPEEFYRFYWDKMIYIDAKPNNAHKILAKWEQQDKVKAVITQNIDGLHQKAGSQKVLELHGTVYKNYCMRCGKKYKIETMLEQKGIPYCECGGIVRPDVVLYEEGLDQKVIKEAVDFIEKADVFIIGGTSLTVYPAAGLIEYYGGNKLVLINKSMTPYDKEADLRIEGSIGEIFERADKNIN